MKGSGIYKIQSVIKPERVYVGSAKEFRQRWSSHLSKLRKGKHHSCKLQNHFNKYGEKDLVFIIIEPCLLEFLTVREQFYIKTLKPWFNIRSRAESNLGLKWTEESCKKMIGNKNGCVKRSKEACANMSKSKLGNKNATGCNRSEKFKNNLRIIKTGNTHGIGNKSRTGQTNSVESNESRRKSLTGKPKTEAAKINMRGHIPWNKGLKLKAIP